MPVPVRRRRMVVGALLATLIVMVAWAGHRHVIARSVLHHPVAGAVVGLAGQHDWQIVVDDRDTPGVEPLWMAGMMGDPYRREVIIDTSEPADVAGPLVESALFGVEGWEPSGETFGLLWRTSTIVSAVSRHSASDGSAPGGTSFVAFPAGDGGFYQRATEVRVEVADGWLAVVTAGGERWSPVNEQRPLYLESGDPPDWHP